MDVAVGEYGADIAVLAEAAQLHMRSTLADVCVDHMTKGVYTVN